MFGYQFTLYHHVIYLDFNVLTHLQLKHPGHHPLIGGTGVLQTKRHHFIVVVSNGGDKSCLFLIIYSQGYLMISLKGVYEAHSRMSHGCVYQPIYSRHREGVFWAGLI